MGNTVFLKVQNLIEDAVGDHEGADRNIEGYQDDIIEELLNEDKFDQYIEFFCFRRNMPLNQLIDKYEKIIITWALNKFSGNQKKTAEYLGLKYTTLRGKMKKLDILQ